MYLLLWLKEDLHPDDIDKLVSAEIPDRAKDPDLYDIVTTCMIHGPCGKLNRNSPCMKNGKCTKKFPKQFMKVTESDGDGYPEYRRRSPEDGGNEAKIKRGGRKCSFPRVDMAA